MISLGLY